MCYYYCSSTYFLQKESRCLCTVTFGLAVDLKTTIIEFCVQHPIFHYLFVIISWHPTIFRPDSFVRTQQHHVCLSLSPECRWQPPTHTHCCCSSLNTTPTIPCLFVFVYSWRHIKYVWYEVIWITCCVHSKQQQQQQVLRSIPSQRAHLSLPTVVVAFKKMVLFLQAEQLLHYHVCMYVCDYPPTLRSLVVLSFFVFFFPPRFPAMNDIIIIILLLLALPVSETWVESLSQFITV